MNTSNLETSSVRSSILNNYLQNHFLTSEFNEMGKRPHECLILLNKKDF